MLKLRLPLMHRTAIVETTPRFEHAMDADWRDTILDEDVTDKLFRKQGRSIARWTKPPLVMFLKRHYQLPKLSGLLARLFPNQAWSPGLQEWRNLQWAESNGIPVPHALAAAEWRGPGLKLQSFLAVEELADMLPLHEAIPLAQRSLTPIAFQRWKQSLIVELARIAVELHRKKAFHKDLYLCHFYILASDCSEVQESFRGRMVAIDFHRLGHHTLLARYFQVKDLAQLFYSTLETVGISDRDRLRFWNCYRELFPVPRWIFQAVRWKYLLYLRHSRRKAARRGG